MKINIGSGYKKRKDYVNIDISPTTYPDIVRDIEKGLPFSDSTIDEVITEHFLEHVRDIHFVMFEIWRVLKKGCKVHIVVPIGKGWQNSPEHVTPFDYKSWLFFTEWNRVAETGYNFKLIKQEIVGEDLTEELHFTMECIK